MGKAKKQPARRFVVGKEGLAWGRRPAPSGGVITMSEMQAKRAMDLFSDAAKFSIYELVPRPDLLPKGGA